MKKRIIALTIAFFTVFIMLDFVYAYAPRNIENQSTFNGSVVILSANTPQRDLLADGPWRVKPGQSQFPNLVTC